MNINLRIDITPGSAKRAAYIGLTLLAFGLAGVAYAVPVTFTSHQKLTAEQLNQNFGDLDARVATLSAALALETEQSKVPVITEWQSYTPQLTTWEGNPVTGHTSTGYYRRVGDSIEVRTVSTFTAEPNSGTKKWWQCSIPEGLTIDTKAGALGETIVGGGAAQRRDQNFVLATYVRSSTGVSAVPNGTASVYINDHNPIDFSNEAYLSFDFTVPIVGWTATQ